MLGLCAAVPLFPRGSDGASLGRSPASEPWGCSEGQGSGQEDAQMQGPGLYDLGSGSLQLCL